MKKQLCMIALVGATAFGTTGTSWSLDGPPPPEPPPMGKGQEHFLERMASVLKLTDAQQAQIEALISTDAEQNAPLHRQLAENERALREATTAASLDEATVRALAATKGNLMTEMIVSRAKLRNAINAILTAEQRELADRLDPLKYGPPRPRPDRPGME